MSDWEPRSLMPSDNPWDAVDSLEVMRQQNPARISAEELDAIQQRLNTPQMDTVSTSPDGRMGGYFNAPTTVSLNGQSWASYGPKWMGLTGSGETLDIQQGVVDFVRYFLPGSDFDPQTASPAFDLGSFLLELMILLLTLPGGAMLVYSIMTTLNRDVPELGAYVHNESRHSILDWITGRQGKLLRKLLRISSQHPIPSPAWLSRIENFIHMTATEYHNMEALDAIDDMGFLGRLFNRVSDALNESIFPGQKAGLVGLFLYFIAMAVEVDHPDMAEILYAGGDATFSLSTLFNLGDKLKYLQYVESAGDLLFLTDEAGSAIRLIDELDVGVAGRGLVYVDGVLGGVRYVDSIVDLLSDPALNPAIAGNSAWRDRISLMFSGMSGAFSFGAMLLTIITGGAALVPLMILAGAICTLTSLTIEFWDEITDGFNAVKYIWQSTTQIIIPYRISQAWGWFDDHIGRPVRQNVLQPIGDWAQNTLSGLAGWAQSLAGD